MIKAARRPDSGEVRRRPFSATFSQAHRYMRFNRQRPLFGSCAGQTSMKELLLESAESHSASQDVW